MTPKPFTKEKYAPNNEITGDYDKSLAAKCENGTFVGYLENDVLTFKGIPFAKPPVGKLRWKRPLPVDASEKVFEAYHSGKLSIQPPSPLDGDLSYEMGEDCLYLNVYKNIADKTENKAVMVWIHGGACLSGGNSSPNYDGYNFISENSDVILVAINYRLGISSFVNFANIKGGENYSETNFGVYDQIEALKWVKKNIAAFGGDPDRITIFGESAGAGSVSSLAVMKEAKGLFKRVIVESGSVGLCTSTKTTTLPIDNLAKAFGAKNMDDLLAIPEDKLIEYWKTGSAGGYSSSFVLDGHIFDGRDPFELWNEGVTKDLDILQGFMADEWRVFAGMFQPREFYNAMLKDTVDRMYDNGNDEYKRLHTEYLKCIKDIEDPAWPWVDFISDYYFCNGVWRQLSAHAKNGGRGYAYIMDKPCSIPALKSPHGSDFYFVFGNFDGNTVKETVENREFTKKLQKLWVNFAKTGDPSSEDLSWKPYDTETRATAMLGNNMHIENDPRGKRRELLGKMAQENLQFSQSKILTDMVRDTLEDYPQFKK